MLTHKKDQGFIIRKTRNPAQDQEDRRRYMSQTQFYPKKLPHSPARVPGQILHVRLKEDVGFIRSSHSNWFNNNEDIDSNPEHNSPQLKFKFQESGSDLKQRGDAEAEAKEAEEEGEGSRVQDLSGLKIEQNINVTKILDKLHYQLQHRSTSACSSEILMSTKEYLDYVHSNELASVNALELPTVRKKLIKESLLYERISILMVSLVEVLQKFPDLKSYVLNLINFAIDNMLLRLAILSEGRDKAIVELLRDKNKEKFLCKGFEVIKNNNEMMAESINKVSRADNLMYENLKKLLKANKTLHVKGQFAAIQEYFAFFMCASGLSEKALFLSVAPSPYLPEQTFKKYTLVIDVLQCFCCKGKKSTQTFRPFAEYFLDEMSQYYEIVSMSDGMPVEINRIIGLLDRKKHIKHRLYSYHLDKTKSFNGKDLSRLGRNMETTILLDTSSLGCKSNTITVSPWRGRKNDAELAELCPILAMIALKKIAPQTAIKKLQQKNEENQKIGLKYLNCGINFQ